MLNIYKSVFITLALLLCTASFAQENEHEVVVDSSDENIKWGACPPFLGKGC